MLKVNVEKVQLHNIILLQYLCDCPSAIKLDYYYIFNSVTYISLDIYITSDSSHKKMSGYY